MSKSLMTLLLSLLLAGPAWAQDDANAGDVGEPKSVDASAADEAPGAAEIDEPEDQAEDDASNETDQDDEANLIVDPEFDDAALDEQTYEEDDDDFVPSEEIPADEPIPFPSNI